MYRSKEFMLEVWPGEVRIHQGDDEYESIIELSAEQVGSFCARLMEAAREARDLGEEFRKKELSADLAGGVGVRLEV